MRLVLAVKERPILFSAPMIRAILAGTKTQTRRIVKPQPSMHERSGLHWKGVAYGITTDGQPYVREFLKRCPYGVPGDRLWVRETWQTTTTPDDRDTSKLEFAADWNGKPVFCEDEWTWRPSIFMPRWASRITLEVTGVRVERLHDITEAEAKAEGATPYIYGHGFITEDEIAADPGIRTPSMYRAGFEQLWREINGCDSWEANPWVWVVEFRRLDLRNPAEAGSAEFRSGEAQP